MAVPFASNLPLRAPNGPGPFAPGQQTPPPTDLNAFLVGIGATGMSPSGQPVGSTGGTIPLQQSQQERLAGFTSPSQMQYNGGVDPLQKLNELLGVQTQPQGMRVPQSQFESGGAMRVPQSNYALRAPAPGQPGQGAMTMAPGTPSSTPMIGRGQPSAPAPTQVSAFGEQVRTQGPQTRNGATFSATEEGFSIVQDPNTVPAQGMGSAQSGTPGFLQGQSPDAIAAIINAIQSGGSPAEVSKTLRAGQAMPPGVDAKDWERMDPRQRAAWAAEQALVGQQAATIYNQAVASGLGTASTQRARDYNLGIFTNAYNQALSGQGRGTPSQTGGMPGLTPVQNMAQQAAAQANAKPIKPVEITQGEEVVTIDANTGSEIGRAPRTTPPPGYRRTAGGALEPIPGSKDDREATAAAKKAAARSKQILARSDVVMDEIRKILPNVDGSTAGPVGAALSLVPGTDAADIAATVETIQARLAFDELQAIRDASQTGGALGQVAVKELDLLKAGVSNLRQTQSPKQFAENLRKIYYHYGRWKAAEEGVDPDTIPDPMDKSTASQIGGAARKIGRFMVRMAGESQ